MKAPENLWLSGVSRDIKWQYGHKWVNVAENNSIADLLIPITPHGRGGGVTQDQEFSKIFNMCDSQKCMIPEENCANISIHIKGH